MADQNKTKLNGQEVVAGGYAKKRPGKNSFSGHEKNCLFVNSGKGQFANMSPVSGIDSSADGRAFVILDFDRDGDQDIALVNANDPVFELFQNNTADRGKAGNFVAVRLVGGATPANATGWSNRSAVGAKLIAEVGERKLLRETHAGEGLGAQNSATMLIGIDVANRVDRLEVRWPSGRIQHISDIQAGTLLTVHENPDEAGTDSREYLLNGNDVTNAAIDLAEQSQPSVETGGEFLASLPERCEEVELTLLTSMATWCSSCKKHIATLKHLESQFPADSLCLLGLPIDDADTREKLTEYERRYQPPYETLSGWTRELVGEVKQHMRDAVGTEVLPTTMVVNNRREVVAITQGIPSVSELRKLLHRSRLSSKVAERH